MSVLQIGTHVIKLGSGICATPGGGSSNTGYDGVVQINSSGVIVNGHNNALLLIGANSPGLDGQGASGFWNSNPWGSVSQAAGAGQTGLGGPAFVTFGQWQSPTSTLTAMVMRITINTASFLGSNQFLLDPTGSASAPVWLKTTATATTTNGTVLTVASTSHWNPGVGTNLQGCMITDLTGGSTIPANTTVAVNNGTQLTCSQNVTVNNGDVLYATQLADPNSLFRPALIRAINYCRANKIYVHLNCHINGPQLTIGGVTQWISAFGQLQFIDDDTAQAYWISSSTSIVAWLATNFGSSSFNTTNGFNGGAAGTYNNPAIGGPSGFGDIIFEPFNEPFYGNQPQTLKTLAGGTPASNEACYLNGCYSSFIMNNGGGTNGIGVGIPSAYAVGGSTGAISANFTTGNANGCKMGGYQSILNGIRAMGATNIIVVGGDDYSSKQSTISSCYPTDGLGTPQVATGYHCYQSASTNYPNTGDPGSGTAACLVYPEHTIAGTGGIGFPVPVFASEFGNSTSNGGSGIGATQPDPYIVAMDSWFDSFVVHNETWQWSGPAPNGYAGTTFWCETIMGSTTTFTGSIDSSAVLHVTSISGTPIANGFMVISNGSSYGLGLYVISTLTGSGGVGTYQLSANPGGTLGSTSITGAFVVPLNGQGQTRYNYSNGHA